MNNLSKLVTSPTRQILDGVPRIGFDIHLSPFPGALYSVLEYLKDGQNYDYLMGITGAAFRRLWNRDDGGNVDLWKFGEKPFRLAFDALGYEWQTIPREKDALIDAIKESLARGIPVISFGVLGPPEAGIVTGYDSDGAVLFGWSCFQPDGSRYYEKSDWFETMEIGGSKGWDWIVIGSKKPGVPADREVLVTALEWALDLECTSWRPETPEHVCGLDAYTAWADALEVDADYPPDDPQKMEWRRMVYGDQCTMLVERQDAARFLRRMNACAPEAAEPLEQAAALFEQVGGSVSRLWPWPFEANEGALQGLADPQKRRELAGIIRVTREKESLAVVYLKRALAVLK